MPPPLRPRAPGSRCTEIRGAGTPRGGGHPSIQERKLGYPCRALPSAPKTENRPSKQRTPAPLSQVAGGAVFARARGAESGRFGSETVLLDPEGQMMRGLNATGARVWELLDGARPLTEIARAVAADFGITHDRALADVLTFVAALEAKGLVSRGAPR